MTSNIEPSETSVDLLVVDEAVTARRRALSQTKDQLVSGR